MRSSNSKNIEFDKPVSISVLQKQIQYSIVHHFLRKLYIFSMIFMRFSFSLFILHRKVLQARMPDFTKEIVKPSFLNQYVPRVFFTRSSMILVLGCTAEISRSKRYSNETLGCASIEYKGGWLLPRCIVPHTGFRRQFYSYMCIQMCIYIFIYI